VVNFETRCTSSDLVATSDGIEVDRKPPPFCSGEEWVIREDK
jgi:hypothetical protein